MKVYCPIFDKFINEFFSPFVGQPAPPPGGGTLPFRGEVFMKGLGEFSRNFLVLVFNLVWEIFCCPFGKKNWTIKWKPKWKPKWKIFGNKSDTKILWGGYEIILDIFGYFYRIFSYKLSVNPPPEGAALSPFRGEVFMNGPGNFPVLVFNLVWEIFCCPLGKKRKKLDDKSEYKTIFILVSRIYRTNYRMFYRSQKFSGPVPSVRAFLCFFHVGLRNILLPT